MDMVPGRQGQAVKDPYYGDDEGFETTWSDVGAAARALVGHLREIEDSRRFPTSVTDR